jgi:hypothetical protein
VTIKADILRDKYAYIEHLGRHKCSLLKTCEERSGLLGAWMATAGLWGTEPDDDERQRDHYHEQFGA